MDTPIFVDTNVFLRFFVRDVEPLYQKARELFQKAEEGKIVLETTDLVIAEIVWVLESYYDLSRVEIKEIVETILETKNIRIINKSLIEDAIGLYGKSKMDFVDAFNAAYMKKKGMKNLATFDKAHYKNIEGLSLLWS